MLYDKCDEITVMVIFFKVIPSIPVGKDSRKKVYVPGSPTTDCVTILKFRKYYR